MPLNVNEAFTWKGTAHQYIQEITGDVLDGDHRTIEVAIFNPVVNGQTFDYFMLVNRYCSSDNNGTAAPPQTLTVRINKTGQYQIRDLYTGELFVSSDGYFRNITIGPGRGRVFELRQMFVSNETWETDAVNVSSSITLPSGKTLNISSNSIIKFYSDTELKVQGTLVANGVTFTAAVANANPGYWSRIYFYYANSSSRIQQSTIEKANYGIFCDHASPTLDFNLVKLNVYGIYCQSSSNPYINENYITNNSSYGIYLTQKCNPYIRHNAIQYNGSKGILCLNSSSPNLIGKSSSEPYGANKITENNDHGVSAETNSKPNLGAVTKGSSQGYNDIYSNADKQVSNYTARRVTIYAKKNWWGTAKPGSGLFYGSVNYSSPLSAPSPYAGPTWGIDNSTPSPIVADDNYADEAEKYLDQGQIFEGDEKYEEAVTAYRCVVDNFGESEHSPTAFSRLMACRDKQGDITVESKYVASLTKKGNTDEISSSALLWEPLIEAQAKKYEHALNMCDQLIKKYADDDLARDAWFEKGSIQLFEMSDIEAAKQTLAEFAQTYPEDPLVEHIAVIISSYTLPSMKLPKPTVPNDNQQHDLVIPEKFTLLQNYPNPFNPETEIPYQLPAATHINLTIYNLLGQKIRSLVDKEQEAGFHSVHWDGNDENGTSVASGVYLYAICVDEFKKVKKVLLVR
jgi:parallel beta-helix repeat protein